MTYEHNNENTRSAETQNFSAKLRWRYSVIGNWQFPICDRRPPSHASLWEVPSKLATADAQTTSGNTPASSLAKARKGKRFPALGRRSAIPNLPFAIRNFHYCNRLAPSQTPTHFPAFQRG